MAYEPAHGCCSLKASTQASECYREDGEADRDDAVLCVLKRKPVALDSSDPLKTLPHQWLRLSGCWEHQQTVSEPLWLGPPLKHKFLVVQVPRSVKVSDPRRRKLHFH